jgi:hypothetical protein
MIDVIVTFMNHFGHRQAEVIFLATGMAAPYLVEMIDENIKEVLAFTCEDDALEQAQKFAFGGDEK